MFIKIYHENPNQKDILKAVKVLEKGGVIIYPTDTVYGIGCDIYNQKGIERIAKIKEQKPKKANFSFICYDLSHVSEFTKPVDNDIFKMMKKNLPGPFTFILPANNKVPKFFKSKKNTVGIRIPNNDIIREIVKELGNPILTTSLKDDDEIIEYTTDPELINERYKETVDLIIDGGYGGNIPSTVIDCTGDDIEIIRKGKGELI